MEMYINALILWNLQRFLKFYDREFTAEYEIMAEDVEFNAF
jgi:hypothetical protein